MEPAPLLALRATPSLPVRQAAGGAAIVAVLLTRGRPWPLFFITLLFGVVDSLSFRVQGLGMPQQFTDMMPYLATLAVLTAISWWYRKSRT